MFVKVINHSIFILMNVMIESARCDYEKNSCKDWVWVEEWRKNNQI